ncbi:acetamidase/formamidase family protein [Paenibacillus xerothermodurans]|uniref:Acetamidase n=1 Tax=Paenibacillus xerothermodurans TaxID=1977292 RepID=A0A2W1NZF4_PAEXE|nr:acetamidase/formamidase family protein [Paenibacillus xerothermodurans]PZE20902.1 acetamidase [Paenibacillus xerothermodurans]
MTKKRHGSKAVRSALLMCGLSLLGAAPWPAAAAASAVPILQPTSADKVEGKYYVPSTLDSISWGYLPNRDSKPISTVPSGSTVTFDTVSHEGILADQGRNPESYFSSFGVSPEHVLDDAKAIAASGLEHNFDEDGPHVVTGPIAIDGAEPGDVLKVEVLSLTPRVPYGVISSRHYKGALSGEFPENYGRLAGAGADKPELYQNVSKFTPVEEINGRLYGVLPVEQGGELRFPLKPFMGLMGVAANTSDKLSSVPPIETGGNIDINELGVGSTLYLPVRVKGALFFTGDPHFAQGDGEVSLTTMEASLRGTFRLTLLKKDDPSIPRNGELKQPFAETEDYWIPIGLDPDLDDAMKEAVREALGFLNEKLGMDRATAYAYMSAATDYEVSQVVDKTKGIHALIDKRHFIDNLKLSVHVDGHTLDSAIVNDEFYVPLRAAAERLGYEVKWDVENYAAILLAGSTSVKVPIQKDIYEVNGKSIYHAADAILQEGKTMVTMKVSPTFLVRK